MVLVFSGLIMDFHRWALSKVQLGFQYSIVELVVIPVVVRF